MLYKQLANFGIMLVFHVTKDVPNPLRPFQVVRETDGKVLEEFRRKEDAIHWARLNKKG